MQAVILEADAITADDVLEWREAVQRAAERIVSKVRLAE
jgi:hypothetical protein